MEIKKSFRAVRAFSYVPKHLAAKKKEGKRTRVLLPAFIVLVLLIMVGGGFWLTNLVERNISRALLEQTSLTQTPEKPEPEAVPSNESPKESPPAVFEIQKIISPVAGQPRQGLGWFKHPGYEAWQYHPGYDFQVQTGTEVLAMASGVITQLETGYEEDGLGPRGIRIQIQHPQEASSEYIFPGEVGVSLGQEVQAGQVLGTVRDRKNSQILVHIGLEQKGDVVDWLAILENRG